MADFHFVEDYEAYVKSLIKKYPMDQAMSMAVGGSYRKIGEIEERILRYAGLEDGMSLVDLGCGSGRLAHVVSSSMKIQYLGTDVVQALLDYAKTQSAPTYKFKLHRDLSIPVGKSSVDMICAFSVFTHLLHEETYIYLEDMKRALKPGGKVVFSFLEFGKELHWPIFVSTVQARRKDKRPHLNMFIERNVINTWCDKLNYELVTYIDGPTSPQGGPPLGQSTAILRSL